MRGRRGPRARFTEQLRVLLRPQARAALDELAEREDRLISEIVREAIDEYLAEGGAPYCDDTLDGSLSPRVFVCVMIRPNTCAQLEALATSHGRPFAVEARIAVNRYLMRRGLLQLDGIQPDLLSA